MRNNEQGPTVGFYFAGMTSEEVSEVRARLGTIAGRLGYRSVAGARSGEGNVAGLLVAIAKGHVTVERITDTIVGPVTKAKLTNWIAVNRPELGIDDIEGVKGFYRLADGQAQSFQSCGETWKDVAARLEAIDMEDLS